VSTQPTMPPSAPPAATTIYARGPNLLVRFLWWLFIGWRAPGIAVTIAWVALITIIGIPIALLMFNRTPFIASLYRY
jgi:uncharacterized membrane protein YccF (DUF307 family)